MIPAGSDNVTFKTPRPDFKADAEAILRKFEASCHEDADRKQLELQPDDALDIAGTGSLPCSYIQHIYLFCVSKNRTPVTFLNNFKIYVVLIHVMFQQCKDKIV